MAASYVGSGPRLRSLAHRPGWGGESKIPTDMTIEHISFESPIPSVLSVDGKERVLDFLNRHGGAAPDAEHEADRQSGESGWSEVHAADGYRLRCEWSAIGSERRMSFVEISPQPGIIVDDSAD